MMSGFLYNVFEALMVGQWLQIVIVLYPTWVNRNGYFLNDISIILVSFEKKHLELSTFMDL